MIVLCYEKIFFFISNIQMLPFTKTIQSNTETEEYEIDTVIINGQNIVSFLFRRKGLLISNRFEYCKLRLTGIQLWTNTVIKNLMEISSNNNLILKIRLFPID